MGDKTMSNLKLPEALEYETYAAYCKSRKEVGLFVLPEALWDALKIQDQQLKEQGAKQ
jgi:hypothetical protein